MSDKKSKKKTQILIVVALFAAGIIGFLPMPDGQTIWQKVTGTWTNAPKTKAGGNARYPRPASTPYKYTDTTTEGSGPRRGTNSPPAHDISAREQSDLDRLIDSKTRK